MNPHKIKIFGKYFINEAKKMSIDENLFFDLEKISFISEEMFYDNPINENEHELSFYFSFILDGVLFQINDNQTIIYRGNPSKQIKDVYNSIIVFKLRQAMLQNTLF